MVKKMLLTMYYKYYWLIYIEELKTFDVLNFRGLSLVLMCALYKDAPESYAYIFLKCPYSLKHIRTLLLNSNFFLFQALL